MDQSENIPENIEVRNENALHIPVAEVSLGVLIFRLLETLSAKQKLVLTKRFGFHGATPETLESIGKTLDITRERVRQIEADAILFLKKNSKDDFFAELLSACREILKAKGGMSPSKALTNSVFRDFFHKNQISDEEFRMMELVLQLADLKRIKTSRDLNEGWTGEAVNRRKFSDVVAWIDELMSREKKIMTIEEIAEILFVSELAKKYPDLDAEKLENYLSLSKKFGKNVFGFWGKAKWPLVAPRGVREKALLVFSKEKKPLHFREVSKLIEKYGLSSKKVHPQTVHNELIRDKRFVLIGRGTYALQAWGYEEGTVKDVLVEILKRAGGFLQKDNIFQAVLEKRKVKKATVAVNLADRRIFEKSEEGYRLKVEV